ncbi:S-layer domain-containing protein [Thermodesulfobium narugense DSM 14796]|uniref:S-layer domain-containing protein n=1 Tax=Thermodesulfobium narugense DSM 14796 TaxID=747365 RepID=M1E6I6_9BACT|nr:putative porin [Thermodesulfobium narugense]AEE14188.1 S-layer domain-containing protein [Thermodesulfobium narugense DSM 14796]
MKKIFVIFCSFFVSVYFVSFAFAGPFSDVPANSWAYKAVQDLSAKGLVIGYGDGTFRGERLATRYEMAMVVARMLDMYEKGQNAQDQKIELNANDIATLMKLAQEFKSELASLNVRVAALEKKAALDTVNFTGDARFRFGSEKRTFYAMSTSGTNVFINTEGSSSNGFIVGDTLPAMLSQDPGLSQQKDNTFMQYRIRLNVSAPVADNISFNARLTMEKNAGVNSDGSSNNNPLYASLTGYNDDNNTLYVERSYITWTLNPYPVTFVLGRLPTMDSGAYYNNLFMDTGTEGGMVIFDLSNMLPSTSVSAAWVKMFDGGLVTSSDEANGLKDKDVYVLNLSTKLFNTLGLEADYGNVNKFSYFNTSLNGMYGKYDWWALIGSWNIYNVSMWAGYNGTSTDMPILASNQIFTGTHSVNGGAWRVGATIPLPVGSLTGDFWFGNNKWFNPFNLNTMVSTEYKDYYNVYYTLPVANNATLTLNYDYFKGKKPYATDSLNNYYYTFNPDQIDKDQRYYIQLDVNF